MMLSHDTRGSAYKYNCYITHLKTVVICCYNFITLKLWLKPKLEKTLCFHNILDLYSFIELKKNLKKPFLEHISFVFKIISVKIVVINTLSFSLFYIRDLAEMRTGKRMKGRHTMKKHQCFSRNAMAMRWDLGE